MEETPPTFRVHFYSRLAGLSLRSSLMEHAAGAVHSMLQIQSNPRANEINVRVEPVFLYHSIVM